MYSIKLQLMLKTKPTFALPALQLPPIRMLRHHLDAFPLFCKHRIEFKSYRVL